MDIKSIIFIRRDNIGDLICTTPAIRAVRVRYPHARIAVLVNSYNADAIRNNPDVDDIYVYEKEKHAAGKKGRFKVLTGNLNLIRRVRGEKFDAAIGCSYKYSARLARYTYLTGGKMRIGFVTEGKASRVFYNHPLKEPDAPIHEVEAMMRLVAPLGVNGPPASMSIMPSEDELKRVSRYLKRMGLGENEKLIVFHISSRKAQNRWPRERFKELCEMVQDEFNLRIMLLWSPGSEDNPLHPGDDGKAEWLVSSMKNKPLAYRTESLTELIAAMSMGDMVVCCDGGAMHIAAALGKPVLTVWGSTDKRRWAPWGVPHIILQKETKLAEAVKATEAFEAFKKLYSEISGAIR